MWHLHECVMCTENNVSVKAKFTNWLNISLLLRAWEEKTIHRVKTHRLSGKKKNPIATVSKEGHAERL